MNLIAWLRDVEFALFSEALMPTEKDGGGVSFADIKGALARRRNPPG
jgi:hypothetical protein